MATIIESLSESMIGCASDPARAANLLVRAGAQFVEEAMRDNPDGPVEMVTELSRTEINYEVVIGGVTTGDHGRARTIWHKTVVFGHTDRTVAGGAAFVEAARLQEAVALSALTLLDAHVKDGAK